ncbi:MAG: GTPase HflX [Gammaproteobacteria bacterium]|nr:MAG: GTPase HflX [Gammaproteobacteria bacterium]
MFERPDLGQRAILVHVEFSNAEGNQDLNEFKDLVRSTGAEIATIVKVQRSIPDAKLLIGSGKVNEIHSLAHSLDADIVIFNFSLSPSQERNLEKICEKRVLDRTGLILDIFAQRARSYEGQLQVELAQLKYLSTRLVRGWSHLERQKGGIGLRGPGEKQLESDRRMLRLRIKQLSKRLEKLRKQRDQGRASRRKATTPTVAVVGYTNAGKSTLFNNLTDANVYSADKLFATLDPTLRRMQISKGQHIVLADTVGFIQDLPHDLIESFHATLQETKEADVLLHVVDASDPHRDNNIAQVQVVLEQIDALEVPQIMVYNKIDQINTLPHVDLDSQGIIKQVWLSALNGDGLNLLVEALRQYFEHQVKRIWLHLPPAEGGLRSELYSIGAVLQEFTDDQGCSQIEAEIPLNILKKFTEYQISEESVQRASL